ncbi:nucleoside-diphosphate kinase [Boudabousia tangfeifanii]|uniref:Nucleoside diphosphate kinase n=1 Tax=Boudabousia tangfeifanii TaxID=1912795 RepID=A0A1D9MJQ9_9ACTO|nr:nucleoside-diphosphate kinase [Boudabousia tangfeifanii]AOZ72534.1 nucleoside-diphosphate kinase [Boudabousia tangfeifanii]
MKNDYEKTLLLIKPDGVERKTIGQIISRFEQRGLDIVALKLLQASAEQLRAHYAEHVTKDFYPEMEEYMSRGPICALVIGGVQAQSVVRTMMGATMPAQAAPGTIRGDLALNPLDGPIENLVHGSDSLESAAREISIWFPELAN